jgi:protein tyrosine/serine phosphatase
VIAEGMAYRSAQPDENLLRDVIARFGIRTVINLRGQHPDEIWWQVEQQVCDDLGVELINIPMSAYHLPAPPVLLALYEALTGAEHPIWIHCMAGADRTGAAAAIWCMSVLDQSREEAAQQLSFAYGHIAAVTPAMDYLVAIFQPDPDWILQEYDPDVSPDEFLAVLAHAESGP